MGRGVGGVRARKVTVFPAIFPAFAPEMLSRGYDPAHDSNRCLHCARGRAVDARAGVRARRLGRTEGEEGQDCCQAGQAESVDRGIPARQGGVRKAARRLLGRHRGQTAHPHRQAARQAASRAGGLCPHPAAGLFGTAASGRHAVAAQGAEGRQVAADPARCGFHRRRGRALQVHAAPAGERSRIQARLCEGCARRGDHGRAGGPHLRVRDRRQRHLRRAGGADASQERLEADLAGGRLQPVALHQHDRPAGGEGRRFRQGAEGACRRARRRRAQGDGAQARSARPHDRAHQVGAVCLGRARQDGEVHPCRLRHPCRDLRPRHRPAAADPEAARTRCCLHGAMGARSRSAAPSWS